MFFSPWIFPIYDYDVKTNSVKTNEGNYINFIIALIAFFIWTITSIVALTTTLVGICLCCMCMAIAYFGIINGISLFPTLLGKNL